MNIVHQLRSGGDPDVNVYDVSVALLPPPVAQPKSFLPSNWFCQRAYNYGLPRSYLQDVPWIEYRERPDQTDEELLERWKVCLPRLALPAGS